MLSNSVNLQSTQILATIFTRYYDVFNMAALEKKLDVV